MTDTEVICKGAGLALKSLSEIVNNAIPILGFSLIGAVVAGVITWHFCLTLFKHEDKEIDKLNQNITLKEEVK